MTASKDFKAGVWDNTAPEPMSVGRYLIFDEIGEGGMASVHLGLLTGAAGFQRTVAIKRLHSRFAQDPSFCAQFVEEARLAARIRHPNVAQTLDVLWTGDELLLVLEYLDGDTLSQVLKSVRAAENLVPIEVVAGLMSGVLHGLHAAHLARDEQGQLLNVVHRDVSPQNLLIARDGQVRVLDFGIAKARARGDQTEAGVIKGKFGYVAPEQVRCATLDARTDVYAAGVVLWESLTCRRLFPSTKQVDQVLMQITSGQIAPPSAQRPDVPPELDEIVAKATSKAPEARFQTAEEFAVALEQAVQIANARRIKAWFEPLASAQLAWRAQRIEAIEKAYGSAEAAPRAAHQELMSSSRSALARPRPPQEPTQVTRREAAHQPALELLASESCEHAPRATLEPRAVQMPKGSELEGLAIVSHAKPPRIGWSHRARLGIVVAVGALALFGVALGWSAGDKPVEVSAAPRVRVPSAAIEEPSAPNEAGARGASAAATGAPGESESPSASLPVAAAVSTGPPLVPLVRAAGSEAPAAPGRANPPRPTTSKLDLDIRTSR